MLKTIFVVDDSAINLAIAKTALKEVYRVITFSSAARMFALLEKVTPDMILLDIEMPEMDGFEALTLLKDNRKYAQIPVMFLTSMNDPEIETKGFQMGVVDFVTKPFSESVLLNRIKTHLDIDSIIREKTAQLQNLQNGIVHVLADMVENRDKGTGAHIERTVAYINVLVEELTKRGIYADEVSNMYVDLFSSSARLHDVGKIAISDTILIKPGKLTDEEFAIMKTHCAEGEHVIDQIILRTGNGEFLRHARLFAGTHHERWDGKGYPLGLSGTDIPLHGRIMAIVDVYDALTSERPYKKAFTPDESFKYIIDNAGTHFDPIIAQVFVESRERLMEIYADTQKI
ncbi:MAG: response regulator [Defluviitaleaceae bacterium]|nr:response regulator [Defluviitaleaceae bacterium]